MPTLLPRGAPHPDANYPGRCCHPLAVVSSDRRAPARHRTCLPGGLAKRLQTVPR